jgi:hypothetical protein
VDGSRRTGGDRTEDPFDLWLRRGLQELYGAGATEPVPGAPPRLTGDDQAGWEGTPAAPGGDRAGGVADGVGPAGFPARTRIGGDALGAAARAGRIAARMPAVEAEADRLTAVSLRIRGLAREAHITLEAAGEEAPGFRDDGHECR